MNNTINGNIELLRYTFTIAVAVMHVWYIFYGCTYFMEGAYLAVDFFFVLSGFYLAKKISSTHESAWRYTISRYVKIAFVYISAIIADCILASSSVVDFARTTLRAIPDMLALQSSGFFYPTINVIVWYISAMLIVGFFIVALINLNERLFKSILAPLFIIAGYSIVYYYFRCLDVTTNHTGYLFPISLFRALSGMCLGYVVKSICDKIECTKGNVTVTGKFAIYCVLLVSISLIFYAFLHSHSSYSFMFLLGSPVMIICCNVQNMSTLRKFMGGGNFIGQKLSMLFGRQFSLTMYCYSIILFDIMQRIIPISLMGRYTYTAIYLVFLILCSWGVSRLADVVNKRLLKF